MKLATVPLVMLLLLLLPGIFFHIGSRSITGLHVISVIHLPKYASDPKEETKGSLFYNYPPLQGKGRLMTSRSVEKPYEVFPSGNPIIVKIVNQPVSGSCKRWKAMIDRSVSRLCSKTDDVTQDALVLTVALMLSFSDKDLPPPTNDRRKVASWSVILLPRARSTLAPRASLLRLSVFSGVGAYRCCCRRFCSRRSKPCPHSLISCMRGSPEVMVVEVP